jgi:hypothetical protein
VGVAIVLALPSSASAAPPVPIPDNGVIHACYARGEGDGEVRIVPSASDCHGDEQPLAWNQKGPRGLKGEKGDTGSVVEYESSQKENEEPEKEAAVKLTRLDVALPFWLAAGLVVIGAIVADLVTDKVAATLRDWADEAGGEEHLPYAFMPLVLGRMSVWTIDAAQVVTTILAPLVGLFLLWKQSATGVLVAANVVTFLAALVGFWYFWKKSPDEYAGGWHGHHWPLFLTPLSVLAFVLNAVGGGIAYAIGP